MLYYNYIVKIIIIFIMKSYFYRQHENNFRALSGFEPGPFPFSGSHPVTDPLLLVNTSA